MLGTALFPLPTPLSPSPYPHLYTALLPAHKHTFHYNNLVSSNNGCPMEDRTPSLGAEGASLLATSAPVIDMRTIVYWPPFPGPVFTAVINTGRIYMQKSRVKKGCGKWECRKSAESMWSLITLSSSLSHRWRMIRFC